MKQYIGRRVLYSLLSLFLLSVTIFLFVRVTGDPAALLVEPGASHLWADAYARLPFTISSGSTARSGCNTESSCRACSTAILASRSTTGRQ